MNIDEIDGGFLTFRVEGKVSPATELDDQPWVVLEELIEPGRRVGDLMAEARDSDKYDVVRAVNERTGFTRDIWRRVASK